MSYTSYFGSSTYGASIVPAAGANTKGSYVQLTSSSAFDSSKFWLGYSAGFGLRTYLVDFATGAAASETVRVANILMDIGNGGETSAKNLTELDIDITSGTRIALRCQSDTGASQQVDAWILSMDRALTSLPDPVTYGANTADSGAVAIDPGATINTKGAYSEISASASADLDILTAIFGKGSNDILTSASWRVDISTGAAASETVQIPDFVISSGTFEHIYLPAVARLQIEISSGTRIAARAQSSINGSPDRIFDLELIGNQVASSSSGGEKSTPFIGIG